MRTHSLGAEREKNVQNNDVHLHYAPPDGPSSHNLSLCWKKLQEFQESARITATISVTLLYIAYDSPKTNEIINLSALLNLVMVKLSNKLTQLRFNCDNHWRRLRQGNGRSTFYFFVTASSVRLTQTPNRLCFYCFFCSFLEDLREESFWAAFKDLVIQSLLRLNISKRRSSG